VILFQITTKALFSMRSAYTINSLILKLLSIDSVMIQMGMTVEHT